MHVSVLWFIFSYKPTRTCLLSETVRDWWQTSSNFRLFITNPTSCDLLCQNVTVTSFSAAYQTHMKHQIREFPENIAGAVGLHSTLWDVPVQTWDEIKGGGASELTLNCYALAVFTIQQQTIAANSFHVSHEHQYHSCRYQLIYSPAMVYVGGLRAVKGARKEILRTLSQYTCYFRWQTEPPFLRAKREEGPGY